MDSETFLFRKCLYQISNHLSNSEIEKLKFMLDDDLPRAQLEAASTGFDLFCLMEEKNFLSLDELEFMRDILQTVGKDHYLDRYISGKVTGETQLKPIPGMNSVVVGPGSEDKTFRRFLGQLSDAMSYENVHDVALFFHGDRSSIQLRDVEKIRTAEEVFKKLLDKGAIREGELTIVYNVLDVLGRQDMCTMIEKFYQEKAVVETDNKQCPAPPPGAACSDESSQHCQVYLKVNQPISLQSSFGTSSSGSTVSTMASLEERDTSQRAAGVVTRTGVVPKDQQLLPPMSMPPSDGDKVAQLEAEKYQLEKQLAHAEKQLQSDGSYRDQVQRLERALRDKINEVEQLQSSNKQLSKVRGHHHAYEMKRKPHGVAVVIVNEKFDKNPCEPTLELIDRVGAPKDARLLAETFTFLGYKVEPHYNLTSFDMYNVMEEICNRPDHSNYDSFVCCISTHGNVKGLYGADSVLVKRDEFQGLVKNAGHLRGKPKLFFIQACRMDQPLPVNSDGSGPKIPPHDDHDIFVVNAATPNNEAYISPEYGSWLASALHKVLTDPQHAHTCSLQSMVNTVALIIQEHVGQLPGGGSVTQCVHRENTLTKEVMFFQN